MTETATAVLAVNRHSIDVYSHPKETTVRQIAAFMGLRLSELGVIGDGANDIGMLSIEGIGAAATVHNGQPEVKKLVASLPNGFSASAEAVAGVSEFLKECVSRRIKRVIADRDGVLRYRCDGQERDALIELIRKFNAAGIGIDILTGSSVEQNVFFLQDSGIAAELACSNVDLRIYAENGVVEIDPRTKSVAFVGGDECEWFLPLIPSLTTAILAEITDTVLHRFNVSWGSGEAGPTTLVSVPKLAMVTIDTPKEREYDDDDKSELRAAVVHCFEHALEMAEVHYVKVDGEKREIIKPLGPNDTESLK